MLLLVAAVVAFTAPDPMYMDSWLSPALDFPRKGLPPNKFVKLSIELTVNPNGYMENCRSMALSGNPAMGPYTCKLIGYRAYFRPARDLSGRKSYGVYRTRVSWWNGDGSPPDVPQTWDFEARVAALPPSLKEPVVQRIKFAVDAAGRILACGAEGNASAELAAQACAQLPQSFRVEPARTRSGRAVPSVQDAAVHLVMK